MSYLSTQPEVLNAVSREMANINFAVQEGNSAFAGPTTGVLPAAADMVSMLTAAQFSWHAKFFHEINAEAVALREQMATMLGISADSYAATEVANTAVLN